MAEFFANVGTSIGTSILVNAGTKEFSKVFNDAKQTHVIPVQAVKTSDNPAGQVFVNGGAALGNLVIGAEQSLQNQATSFFTPKTTGVSSGVSGSEAFNNQPHQVIQTGSGQIYLPPATENNPNQAGQQLNLAPQPVQYQPQYYLADSTNQANQGYNPSFNDQQLFTIQHPITGQDILVSR